MHAHRPEGPAAPIGCGKSNEKDTTFRGTSMPAAHLRFFHRLAGAEEWYRVPHPLATSFTLETAQKFMAMAPAETTKVLFVVKCAADSG